MDYIKIPLYYQEDKEGNKEYDFRHMVSEFETELKKLDKNVVVLCSTFKKVNTIK
tara:strand:+ start:175 stop:339 length:165 start_codon:yes stop_codon:yes gene_type:complete